MAKIGVFTCWCGENIARHIDVERVSKAIESLPGVHCSMNYKKTTTIRITPTPGKSSKKTKLFPSCFNFFFLFSLEIIFSLISY